MTNQLSNEFIFSTNSPIALNDGINLVAQPLIHGQVNNVSAPVNNGAVAASIWPTVNNNNNNNPNCEINYNLLQVTEEQQQQQHQLQPPTQQTVSFSTNNLPQIQAQNMSQIVLLPTQNINVNLMQNEVGYQLLTNTIPNVGVLVPTNILLTNGYFLLPNSQNACQAIALETSASTPTNDPSISVPGHLIAANAEFDAVAQQQQQQLLLQQQESAQQLQQQQEQECEYVALTDSATQTVFSGLAVETSELNNGQTTAHLISNGQIVGIIGSDQLSLLQQSDGGENQVLLAACIDANESGLTLNGQTVTDGITSYDINTMLAQSIATAVVEKSDQDQAKQWLKDSYIVNRALKALKKTNGSSHHHHNRPHPQVIRRRE